ncbi:MAG: tail fiber domain-containing protein [Bdellovibrionaceae bacterium]|nr:tail fiber domain-containing protein [Pseudobdellovibrionaceae bacterium]
MGDLGGAVEDVTGVNMGSHGSGDRAIRSQREAAAQANALQLQMYNQTRADQEPWRQAGMGALTQMQDPGFQRDFSMSDYQQDPGFQFRMSEGMKAIQGSAAAKGSLNSGATLKGLMRYGQGVASEEYQNAYNRFNTNQTNRFNRLSTLAGTGQTATNQVQAANQNYGGTMNENLLGMGNAEASRFINQGNRMAQFYDNGQETMGQAAGAMAAMFSDERMKSDILKLSKSDYKDVPTYIFRYKDEKHGKGFQRGVMAQDLLAIDQNHPAVSKADNGFYRVDYSKLERSE